MPKHLPEHLSTIASDEGCFHESPEKELLSAMLARAVLDAANGKGEIRRSALTWMRKRYKTPKAISFQWLCTELGFEPDRVLESVLKETASKRIQLFRKVKLS